MYHPVVQLFNDDALDLPKSRPSGDFCQYIEQTLDRYLEMLGSLRGNDFITLNVRSKHGLVQAVNADLKTCVSQATQGSPADAYESLKRVIDKLGKHFDQFFPLRDQAGELRSLYRMAHVTDQVPGRARLFHCPFQLTQRIWEQRYSVAGLPCLYFGGSSWLCWQELREPDKEHLYISRFAVANGAELKVMNMGHRPGLIAAMVNAKLDEANRVNLTSTYTIAYAACWPLMAVCAIRRLESDTSKPEYLVPQMLLKWVTETKAFNGIRFFSTRVDRFFDDPKTNINYVFPARTSPPAGFCKELCNAFHLTDPIRWPDALKLPLPTTIATPRYEFHDVPFVDLEEEFGRVESVLEGMQVHPVV